jgi:plasmid stability protein
MLRRCTVAQLLVRDLDPEIVERLKQRAKRHNRSLQGEARLILEEAARGVSMEEAREVAERIRKSLAGTMLSDSAELIREDRER